MSFDYWWFTVLIDDLDYERIEPEFHEAESQSDLSIEAIRAIEYWRNNQDQFNGSKRIAGMSQEAFKQGKHINDFNRAFSLPGFDKLAMKFCTAENEMASFMKEENVIRFISFQRYSPVATLWHCLGYERAKQLPGKMGNILLRSDNVLSTIDFIDRVFDGLNPQLLVKRGMEFAGDSNSDEDVKDVLAMLKDALLCAQANSRGFLALARSQI